MKATLYLSIGLSPTPGSTRWFFCLVHDLKHAENLDMVPRNHWASGLCPLSEILNDYEITFQKLDLLPSSDEKRETPTPLGPFE
jgi:hypothetical protein